MINSESIRGVPINASSPWLKPLPAQVLGGLRGMMTQQTDGQTTILTPRKLPWMHRKEYSYIWIPPST